VKPIEKRRHQESMLKNTDTKYTARGLVHKFLPPHRVFMDLLSGLSLLRSYFHRTLPLTTQRLSGKIIDLGGKHSNNFYHKLLLNHDAEIICTDINAAPGVIAVDVEKALPFADATFDHILAFWLFEHVYDISTIAGEAYRVLKPGGKLLVSVPFQHQYHGDNSPTGSYDDYWRFTHTSLLKWWESAGFKCECLYALGEGMICSHLVRTIQYLTPPQLGIRKLFSAAGYLFGTVLERIASIRPGNEQGWSQKIMADGYLAVFVKPE